jgi:hypothetical protein
MPLPQFKSNHNDKFQDLGSIEDYFKTFGNFECRIIDIEEPNIKLLIISEEEVETIMTCSQKLSKIIKDNSGFPKGMNAYRILRIVNLNSKPFIRISVNMNIDWDGSSEVYDDVMNNQAYNGNLIMSYKIT